MLIKSLRSLFIFTLVLIISGCASEKAWKYGAEPLVLGKELVDKSVVVPPFDDQRKNENSNNWALYLIPLMPYGWQDLNTPEGVNMHATSTQWQWRPNEDIAKATAEEINHSGIFKETFFSNRANDGDLVLQGTIISTKYDGKILSYGLSAYGPMFWLLGLPAASVSNELVLQFKLEDRKNKKVIWQKNYTENVSQLSWIYSLSADFQYSELLKKILLNVVRDIRAEVPKN